MRNNRLYKFIQAIKTGGPVYAARKVNRYVTAYRQRKKVFSINKYVCEELPEKEHGTNFNACNACDISIVIPTYNAGIQFRSMLESLRQQVSCGTVELVVVDSGSTDQTLQLCQEYEVTLIEIPQEQFSHSYARNLGAEAATGDILVFMTQDALPSSKEWLFSLTEPVRKGETDAVSCGEECPEGTDLYYKISCHGHAAFVGFLHHDVNGSKEKCTDEESLRRYASLSDVACAIRRSTFLRFRHRHEFAEDLDLGVRLLAGGYRTRLLSELKTIHGHNRSADYYMKRGIVESEAFSQIFHREPEKIHCGETEGKIYCSACVVATFLEELQKGTLKEETSVRNFIKQAATLFDRIVKSQNLAKQLDRQLCPDAPLLEKAVRMCAEHPNLKIDPSSRDLAYCVRYYLDNVSAYFTYTATEYMDGLAETLCQCMWKQFALCVGTELAKLKQEDTWKSRMEELAKGV